jgi:hypothetical protein
MARVPYAFLLPDDLTRLLYMGNQGVPDEGVPEDTISVNHVGADW